MSYIKCTILHYICQYTLNQRWGNYIKGYNQETSAPLKLESLGLSILESEDNFEPIFSLNLRLLPFPP